jgi:hypothetical protein
MRDRNDEVERFKRIRDRQISSRDPQTKQRRLQRGIAQKRQRSVKRFSFLAFWREVSHKARGTLIGAILGMVVLFVLPQFVEAYWVDLAGVAAIIIFAIVGFMFGQALDTRDSLQDLIKK